MSKYWSPTVRNLEPYIPGEQPQDRKYIKLNTNESPYPPSPLAVAAIREAAGESLRLYPDPNCLELREAIAGFYALQRDQVFVGNGSDEVLAFAFQAFFDPQRTIIFPEITYTFYPVYANLYGLNYQTIAQGDDFQIDLEPYCSGTAGGIILANPNSPTGTYLPLQDIERVVGSNPQCVVIIDEAYIDFGGESAAQLINKYPNLLVMQTFSKSRSLAGLRIGFALGQQELIQGLDRVKNSFNSYTLDRLAQKGARAAILDREYFEETRAKVIRTRERITPVLRGLGFQVIDSQANFLFISHPAVPAEQLFSRLKEQGILVRHYRQPKIVNYLRVTIGTDPEMDRSIEVIAGLVQA